MEFILVIFLLLISVICGAGVLHYTGKKELIGIKRYFIIFGSTILCLIALLASTYILATLMLIGGIK